MGIAKLVQEVTSMVAGRDTAARDAAAPPSKDPMGLLTELEDVVSALLTENNGLNQKAESLNRTVESQKLEIKNLNETVESQTSEIDGLNGIVESQTSEIDGLNGIVASLKLEIDGLNG